MKPIFMVGFMGTGKTTVSELISNKLGYNYVDLDEEIEKTYNKTISRIFSEDGEPQFRKYEREMLLKYSTDTNVVVSCGGGIVINPDNIETMNTTGFAVCLKASAEEIYKRIKHSDNRPLLKVADPLAEINRLLGVRKHFYACISHQIDTDGKSPQAVAEEILNLTAEF